MPKGEEQKEDIFSELDEKKERIVVCKKCSETMERMNEEDIEMLKPKHSYPRGIYKCHKCNCMVTLEPISAEGGWINKIQPRVV
jgi:uncharacterized protein with PIN domain